jgi:predicted nucleotidyltransferase
MFQELLRSIAQALGDSRMPYMIVGGQAVLLYGEPRLTRDIDVTVGINLEKLPSLLDVAKKADLQIISEKPENFVKETMVLPTRDDKSGIRVDFILSFTPYERQAIERAKPIQIEGTNVYFASPEDVIIHKIFAGRPRDLEDVKGILIKQPEIDIAYLENWLMEFDKTFPDKNFLETFQRLLAETEE